MLTIAEKLTIPSPKWIKVLHSVHGTSNDAPERVHFPLDSFTFVSKANRASSVFEMPLKLNFALGASVADIFSTFSLSRLLAPDSALVDKLFTR